MIGVFGGKSQGAACPVGANPGTVTLIPANSAGIRVAVPGLQKVLIQMAQTGELAGEAGRARGPWGAARAEIAAAEEIAPGDHGGAHRAVLVGALRPG